MVREYPRVTFEQFAASCGVVIKSIRRSDKIQRCGTVEHPRSTNGAYLWDGERGGVMAWDGDGVWRWYGGERRELTPEEKRAWAKRQREAEADRARMHQRAAEVAEAHMAACELRTHGYLESKGFPQERGHVAEDGSLLIPMRDVRSNALLGVQRIYWDGERWQKKMTAGMRAKGAVFRIGPRMRETWLVEGYATGLSVAAALRRMHVHADVLVTFSANNMQHVAPTVQGDVFVFADNDPSGTGEAAANAIGRPYCMAPIIGYDANDWHVRCGIFAIVSKISETRLTRNP